MLAWRCSEEISGLSWKSLWPLLQLLELLGCGSSGRGVASQSLLNSRSGVERDCCKSARVQWPFNGTASCINARDEDALIASLAESGTSKSGVSAPAPAPAPGGVPLSHRMTQKLQSWVVGCCLTCALLAKAIWLDSDCWCQFCRGTNEEPFSTNSPGRFSHYSKGGINWCDVFVCLSW